MKCKKYNLIKISDLKEVHILVNSGKDNDIRKFTELPYLKIFLNTNFPV